MFERVGAPDLEIPRQQQAVISPTEDMWVSNVLPDSRSDLLVIVAEAPSHESSWFSSVKL